MPAYAGAARGGEKKGMEDKAGNSNQDIVRVHIRKQQPYEFWIGIYKDRKYVDRMVRIFLF